MNYSGKKNSSLKSNFTFNNEKSSKKSLNNENGFFCTFNKEKIKKYNKYEKNINNN